MTEFWTPNTVAELEQAITGNAVAENAYLDFKQFPNRTHNGRMGIAKDLAAFSINGGTIIFGIAEDNQKLSLKPQPLEDWREWVSQVGLNRLQPPIRVNTTPLERPDGDSYLVIHIAPSASAPHMADGRYYGRSDTTNTQLSNEEVQALWLRNIDQRNTIFDTLRAEVEREPLSKLRRLTARLFVVAQPVSADPCLLLDATKDQGFRSWVSAFRQHNQAPYSPAADETSSCSNRARGIGRSSGGFAPGRVADPENSDNANAQLVDVEFHEDGGIRLYNSRASDQNGQAGGQLMIGSLICVETSWVIASARRVSEHAHFHGSWKFGVAIHGLRGLRTHSKSAYMNLEPFSDDSYQEVTEATSTELFAAGSPILEALLGRFQRAALEPNQTIESLDCYSAR